MTIFWRDIPAQVNATNEQGRREQVLMHQRFQNAIDRAAQVAGLTAHDDYVTQWRREVHSPDGDPFSAARAIAKRFEQAHSPEELEALVANGGLNRDTGACP